MTSTQVCRALALAAALAACGAAAPSSPAGRDADAPAPSSMAAPPDAVAAAAEDAGAKRDVATPGPSDGPGRGDVLPDEATADAAAAAADASLIDTRPTAGDAPPGADGPVGSKPVFVMVGYGGRRIRSTDLGLTWTDDQRLIPMGGDDQYLLRGVGYGNGLFVATGFKILTSPDGVTWTERANPQQQWLAPPIWGNGRFVAAGGYGYTATSIDGITWRMGGNHGIEAARTLVFKDGTFTAATDQGFWWTSADGESWTKTSGGHSSSIVLCGDRIADRNDCSGPFGRKSGIVAYGEGVYISVAYEVERSTDGVNWTTIFVNQGFVGVAYARLP